MSQDHCQCVYGVLPLFSGLETFSQLVYDDEYGAVSVIHGGILLCWSDRYELFQIFSSRKASMRLPSVTSPGLHIEASYWTALGISCPSKSSWLTWWVPKMGVFTIKTVKTLFCFSPFSIQIISQLMFSCCLFVRAGNDGDEQNKCFPLAHCGRPVLPLPEPDVPAAEPEGRPDPLLV